MYYTHTYKYMKRGRANSHPVVGKLPDIAGKKRKRTISWRFQFRENRLCPFSGSGLCPVRATVTVCALHDLNGQYPVRSTLTVSALCDRHHLSVPCTTLTVDALHDLNCLCPGEQPCQCVPCVNDLNCLCHV